MNLKVNVTKDRIFINVPEYPSNYVCPYDQMHWIYEYKGEIYSGIKDEEDENESTILFIKELNFDKPMLDYLRITPIIVDNIIFTIDNLISSEEWVQNNFNDNSIPTLEKVYKVNFGSRYIYVNNVMKFAFKVNSIN